MTTEALGGSSDDQGGPMWGRFFDSLGGDETESQFSGSHFHADSSFRSMTGLSQVQQSPFSEVHPNDSASAVGDEGSVLDGYPKGKDSGPAPQMIGQVDTALPIDDGTYVFKFRTPSGRTHRFQARNDNLENLRDIISGKLAVDPFFENAKEDPETGTKPDPSDFTLSYTDADGDTVLMTADGDVSDAVKIARTGGADRVVLFIQGGRGWEHTPRSEINAAEIKAAAIEETKAVETVEAALPDGVQITTPSHPHAHIPPTSPELVMGIPKDLLLPASIGALAVVIIGVFTISRMGSR
jgi:hypothetical protein